MARIQNPQNEKGELLATDNKVQELITKRLVPLEDSFRNISNDQFIKVEKGEPDTENNYFKTEISANYTDDINDINVDTIEKENNKLVTTKLLKDVKDTIGIDVKRVVDKLEHAIEKEINDRIEAEVESKKEVEERFVNLEEELEEHITNRDIHVSEEDRELWDYTIKGKFRTLIPDTILIPESENINITDEGGIIRFKLAKNIDNIVIVSYTPHVSNELESSITVDTEQINVNINKKETTPSGEYYIVIELLYIDKTYKSVKRAYTYSKVTI